MAARLVEGFVLVDKPAGITSQDAVTHVRRTLRASRAGHTGTLDPFATGLLVVLLGQATRIARFVPSEPKEYEAEMAFGSETDTDDLTGTTTATASLPEESRVREAMARLTGRIDQVPPAYSAKHVDGRRAYALARSGVAVTLPPVSVDVHSWRVVRQEEARWTVRIACGSGVYIRALVRDLGRLSHSAAHVVALRRTCIGPFRIEDALTPERLSDAPRPRPALDALAHLPRQQLDAPQAMGVRQGRGVAALTAGDIAVLVDPLGGIAAVAEREQAFWQPRVVFADA